MSGQLASWTAQHSQASAVGRAILGQLALCSHPDGTPAYEPTWDDLERWTGYKRSTVAKGLAELRRLGEIKRIGGGGQGTPARYRVVVGALCAPDIDCWSCAVLAAVGADKVHHIDLKRSGKGPPDARKGPPDARKGPPDARKGPPGGPPTDTETDHPQGGTAPSPESSAAPAPSQSAGTPLEPGLSEAAETGEPVRISPTDWWSPGTGAASEPGPQEQEPANNGEAPRRPLTEAEKQAWYGALHHGRPRPSTAEQRAAEEQHKRAIAQRLVEPGPPLTGSPDELAVQLKAANLPPATDNPQAGPSVIERQSA